MSLIPCVRHSGEDIGQKGEKKRDIFGHQLRDHRFTDRLNEDFLLRKIFGDGSFVDLETFNTR